MKNDDTFSDDGAPSSSFPERDVNCDGRTRSSPHNVPQDTSSSTPLPRMERRLSSHYRMRLLLMAMVVVVLVALAGVYGVFRAVSQPSRQTSSAFQQTRCPFHVSTDFVEGQNVKCGFLSVPEDRSLLRSPTIQLAVANFKTPSSQPAPDPVLFLSGGPGDALLENQGPKFNAGNIAYLMSWGMFYSVMCGEDAAFTTQHALELSVQGLANQAQPAMLNTTMSMFSVCQFWGMKSVPATQKEPVRSTIPTLILQGEYDPVTPPTNGMLAAQTLSKRYFFLFPGIGHGVIPSHASNCPNDIMNAFLENPAEKPDASCISTMTEPFFT